VTKGVPRPFRTPAQRTSLAARAVTRRWLIGGAVATGAAAVAGPWIVRDALSSSGALDVLMWSDYLPKAFTDRFEKATGIKVKHTPYSSNEELLAKIKGTKGRGFDIVSPTSTRMPQWRPLELLQPWDVKQVPMEAFDEHMLDRALSAGSWGGKTHLLPFAWRAEGLAWRTDKWSRTFADLSYGNLWLPELKGKIMGRPHSMMLGIGLFLDRAGKLPSNRMFDTYKSEDSMRSIWTEIVKFAVQHKAWIKQFWDSAEAQVSGFRQNGVVLGQTWDGPATRLRNAGEPIMFMAPQEGALAWIDGLSLLAGAKNVEQAYAFLKFVLTPRIGALLTNETGYGSCVAGADKFLSKKIKARMEEAYPGDSLARLWWWPAEPAWHVDLRGRYSDTLIKA
jgi:spermidine/putrescine transport system substrate-binding protein